MISSILRPKKARRTLEEEAFFTSYSQHRHATADWTETEGDEDVTEEEDNGEEHNEGHEEEDNELTEEEDGEDTPLLPIFSAAHLDALPVYNLTHAIRLVVLPRTETTLTWDQLRSPQVSQFLVKPMQQQIRTSHYSRATLYALMANCLQFQKESQSNPGNAGTSKTRALVCELLAIKLLKEYSTRELIDALSYDFFPLQGIANAGVPRSRPSAVRISTLEIAIRASAKRFLAHPLVVQQLEAIWAGTIVFHAHADSLHRKKPQVVTPERPTERDYLQVPGHVGYGSTPQPRDKQFAQPVRSKRTATLYDPRDASLFKLSRLRVPRYRQFFSTYSLAILLGLFVAVLSQRSSDITPLEVVFWFWSAGFMLDEVVGFNEQGFSLYIMSFWNAFDLGILFLLMVYYAMRLYGIFMVDAGRREWNSMAYDVLATNAILLFPRLFSVLDHYRYFSQLLIAFRLMAIDLVAVFILILIACSGFFVAFTLSFGKNEYDAAEVAYKIFQILMGFTPAAWEAWPTYNPLGKALLVLFLFICHFLVVTILITVLTNSFMAIASNAEQEHQFVFAVNTISMVKNDALFSYVAPSNIVAWILTPLRFFLPFRFFIKLNRTVIKLTHFPLLFGIFTYEKLCLASSVFEPTDLVENRGKRIISFQDAKTSLFSPSIRVRQESVAGFQKDLALEEVFRLAPTPTTLRGKRMNLERRQTDNAVHNWMNTHGDIISPPPFDRSTVDHLERKRRLLKERSGTRSAASDPAEFMASSKFQDEAVDDGDDELATHDDEEGMTLEHRTRVSQSHATSSNKGSDDGFFATPTMARLNAVRIASPISSKKGSPKLPSQRRGHNRNMSTNTIVFNPVSDSSSPPKSRPVTAKHIGTNTPNVASGSRTPRNSIYSKSHPRPIIPPRSNFQSMPAFNIDSQISRTRQMRHRRSSLDMGISELGLDHNAPGMLGAVPNSFATQLAMATGGLGGRAGAKVEDDGMMGRLMLARMKTLEEGFAEVVKEFRGMRTAGNSSVEDLGKGKGKQKAKKRRDMVRTTSDVDFAKMDRKEVLEDDYKDVPEGEILRRYASRGSSF